MADLCAIIARRRHEKIYEEFEAAEELGLKLLEVRLDFLSREPRLGEILKHRHCPLIATIRKREDGGLWVGAEDKRRMLLRMAVLEGFDYVDLEPETARVVPRRGQTKRIVSYHNLNGFPENIESIHTDLCALDADIVKIAVKTEKASDNFRILKLMEAAKIPTIALCMGEWGMPSRILGARFGAPYTYAAFNPLRIVAPGLLTVAEFRETFFYESIDRATEVYGVIGDPIAHSLSPLVHNAAFREKGLNKVYVPFRVTAADLPAFLEGALRTNVRGLSVTIPHKITAAQYGTPADDLTAKAKSANTLVRKNGQWKLYNTDGQAVVEALYQVMPPDADSGLRTLTDRTVLILGAGGVARAAAFALRDAGALVVITARREEEAKSLASAVGCQAIDWEQRYSRILHAIVNCTPLGMHPDLKSSAFHQNGLREGMVVLDTVYNPENTTLIREAKERGCHIATGVDVFVRQAEAQFRLFTKGVEPPADLMAGLVREALSPAKAMLREVRLSGKKKEQSPTEE